MGASKKINTEKEQGLLKRMLHVRTRGQALVIVALVLTVLLLFIGLGVDVGNMMGRRAKLQSAVDTAALSAAETLAGGMTLTQTTINKAYQILQANGIPTTTLNLSRTSVDFPGVSQVRVRAVLRVNTFFMRLIPMWQTVEVSAEATADLNAYAEIFTKPYGIPGVVSELNLMVWGPDSSRRGGEAYSPVYVGNGDATTLNQWHPQLPYGYLYRIDVPPNYPSDHLYVEIFDPDGYNRTGTPAPYPTGCPASPTPRPTQTPGGTATATNTPTPCAMGTVTADMYASCTNPSTGTCTTNDARHNTGLKLNAFPSGRPAFWRVDEVREPWTTPIAGTYVDAYTTRTQYTLWHFNPRITSAFEDPSTISDQPSGGYIARYIGKQDNSDNTDLSWYRPSGFDIQLQSATGTDLYERESNGGFYFYLYVQSLAGSSENNFDLRVGPPDLNPAQNCAPPASAYGPCYVNEQYRTNVADWDSGGATIFAKRALPLNLDTGDSFPLAFTQVSKNAAGQTLGIRHFDQDCNNGCGYPMQYQMQLCDCPDPNDPNCWENIATGHVGPNDGWVASGYADPEPVQIPVEGTSQYSHFFGSDGHCPTSWLRIETNPSYSQDSTVWEMPFIRPRLIK